MSTPSEAPTHREHRKRDSPPDLDIPFPYSPDVVPSTSAPVDSKERALAFFLEATASPDVPALRAHAEEIQKVAYKEWSYPCIRRWAFLSTKAAKSSAYDEVLKIGKTDDSAVYLDLGCFVGTDLRKIVDDGWNPERVIGSDLRSEWFDLGYSLYKDKETSRIALLRGDVFDSSFLPVLTPPTEAPQTSPPVLGGLSSLAPLAGHVRCISTFSFFHLFGQEAQHDLARKLAGLLSPKPGSVIFGSHQGLAVASQRTRWGDDLMYSHSPDSWKELWEVYIYPASRAPAGTPGTRVQVFAELKPDGLARVTPDKAKDGLPESVLMQWVVRVV